MKEIAKEALRYKLFDKTNEDDDLVEAPKSSTNREALMKKMFDGQLDFTLKTFETI